MLKAILKSGEVQWVHFDPPCKTFRTVRRTDIFGKARVLKRPDNIEGYLRRRQTGWHGTRSPLHGYI